LSILAKYWLKEGYNKKDVYTKLNQFMIANYKEYNEVKWDATLEKIIHQSKKYPLIEIDCVYVTKNEIQTIQSIRSKPMQRLAFTLLCLAKFYNLAHKNNNDWANSKINDIFNMAHVQVSKIKKPLMLNDLRNLGLIEYSKKVDNVNVNIQFIDNESEVILKINDFRDLGYEYDYYCGGRFVRCVDCNKLIKVKFNDNKTIRCPQCQDLANYTPIETKIIKCIDCGKEVEVDARNMTKVRCDECYKKYRKEKVRKNVENYRKRNNM